MHKHKLHLVTHHGVDFLVLLLILISGFGGLLYFRHQLPAQISVSIIMSILYAFWGIFHHHHEKNLTFEIALEYIAMATLVGFVLIVFLLRA